MPYVSPVILGLGEAKSPGSSRDEAAHVALDPGFALRAPQDDDLECE